MSSEICAAFHHRSNARYVHVQNAYMKGIIGNEASLRFLWFLSACDLVDQWLDVTLRFVLLLRVGELEPRWKYRHSICHCREWEGHCGHGRIVAA